jgi:hypothetical protein
MVFQQDDLPMCLESATTNLLLDNFGCEYTTDMQRRRRELLTRTGNLREKINSHTYASQEQQRLLFEQLLLEEDKTSRFLDMDMSMSTCDYMFTTEVSNIIPIGK